jgi:DNA-binding protein H-NS
MKTPNLENMLTDQLWEFHAKVESLLVEKLTAEKRNLELKLGKLRGDAAPRSSQRLRRRYPEVRPKYRNPEDPSQTWAGRGKTPRWISRMVETGKSVEDLRIA